MSTIYYFASEEKLEQLDNPYIQSLSVNQALQLGIQVDLECFDETLDCDEPDVILYCSDEQKFGYPSIYELQKEDYYENIGTEKQFCVQLQADVRSNEVLTIVLEYIQKQKKRCQEIEVWNVWLGEYNIPHVVKRSFCKIEDVTVEKLKEFYENDNVCMCIR